MSSVCAARKATPAENKALGGWGRKYAKLDSVEATSAIDRLDGLAGQQTLGFEREAGLADEGDLDSAMGTRFEAQHGPGAGCEVGGKVNRPRSE